MSNQLSAKIVDLVNQARHARQNHSIEEAIKYYKSALAANKNALDIHYELAVYYCINSVPEKSIHHYQIIVNNLIQSPDLFANYAIALAEVGRHEDAIIYLQKALNLDKNRVDLYIPLGEAYRRIKEYDKALDTFKIALRSNNKNHAAFCAMGLTYRDIEDYPKALECMECAVGIEPKAPFYRLQFANLLYITEFLDLAEIQIKQVIDSAPTYDAYALYVEILQSDSRYRDCLLLIETMHQKFPNDLNVVLKKAEIYTELNLIEQALELYETLLNSNPSYLKAVYGKFDLLFNSGEYIQAKVLIEAYLKEYPDDDVLRILHLYVKKYHLDDPVVTNLISNLEAGRLNGVTTYDALAKLMESHSQWDEAFKYHKMSKQLRHKHDLHFYSPEKEEKNTDDIIKVFNQPMIDTLSSYSQNTDLPIIILGMPRAGKTILANLLSCHKSIYNRDEIHYWQYAFDAVKKSTNQNFPFYLDHINEEQVINAVEGYIANMMDSLAANNINKVIDTFPYNFQYSGLILSVMPKSTIFHSKRNVMDLCVQIYFKNFKHGHDYTRTLEHIGHFYCQYEKLMKHWKKMFPDRIIDVDFEDMTQEPRQLLMNLIKSLHLQDTDDVIDLVRLEKLEKTIKSYASSVGLWKNYGKHLDSLKHHICVT